MNFLLGSALCVFALVCAVYAPLEALPWEHAHKNCPDCDRGNED